MGMKSRRKGKTAEREIVSLARLHGLEARRTWQSAQHDDPRERACDVTITGRRCQVKVSADGFRQLYAGLESVDILFARSDHHRWLAVLDGEKFLKLLAAHDERRN